MNGNPVKKHAVRRMLLHLLVLALAISGAAAEYGTEKVSGIDFGDYGQKAYEYLQYIDREFPDRDCVNGKDVEQAQEWIAAELRACGFSDEQIRLQEFSFTPEGGRRRTSLNITATLPGQSTAQIIVGAHYDGTGAGDNASGVALLMETASRLVKAAQLPKTIVFAFFSAEEYDFDGSKAYVEAMTRKERDRTEFMINLDSIICGDYCYVYGGVPDFRNEKVKQTEALEKVIAISDKLGLGVRLNPWTFDHPAPGFDVPDYPSPATGDWSDHVSFVEYGIPYVYFEASNWEIPGPDSQYDGDSETARFGRIMHTENDRLDRINALFPGRALYHLQYFSLLLHETLNAE